jgi:long-chain acyl-CoA synthetase
VGFFGMVFVLEGTSVALALEAASRHPGRRWALPDRAFTYLRSHGTLDQEHVEHLSGILDRLDTDEDRQAVTRVARAMFWLYGNVFRSARAGGGMSAPPRACCSPARAAASAARSPRAARTRRATCCS